MASKSKKDTVREVDVTKVAQGLGAKIMALQQITKEESTKYEQVGSPVMVPRADKGDIQYLGSRMLSAHGISIDDVVGYRVLEADEEPEFRKDCGNQYATVACFYAKKS